MIATLAEIFWTLVGIGLFVLAVLLLSGDVAVERVDDDETGR